MLGSVLVLLLAVYQQPAAASCKCNASSPCLSYSKANASSRYSLKCAARDGPQCPPGTRDCLSTLGPGSGKWRVEPPELHGLSTRALANASSQVNDFVPVRDCFLVIKDGVIVHEQYWSNKSKDSMLTSDSMGKSFTGLLVGLAIDKGLLDVDKPIIEYGVQPRADWNLSGHDWYANVTTRHLLTQTSGQGYYKPGARWTYDSNEYIQHLSYVLGKVIGTDDVVGWANAEFGAKLGLPNFWSNDQANNPGYPMASNISAGGGQFGTCRDFARFGQLVLNRGLWPRPRKPHSRAQTDGITVAQAAV